MKAVSHLHVQQYCCHGNCFSTNNVQLLYCLAYGLILVNFDAFYAFFRIFSHTFKTILICYLI